MKATSHTARLSAKLDLGGVISIGEQRISIADTKALLDALAATGTLQGVAEALDLTYRASWNRLLRIEAVLGRQLVKKVPGRGSVLTDTGSALHEALKSALAGLDYALARETRSLNHSLAGLFVEGGRPFSLAVSHDPLLMDVCAQRRGMEVAVVGSGEALARLAQGRADAAGFHCGPLEPKRAGSPFADIVRNANFVVLPLFGREQGLLLARGNPLEIRGLADLSQRHARYINRQQGSGTRVWFDRLLAEEGLRPRDIAGYEVEEFTHHAVAAVIASGAADAGLGARAAAARFGLDFLSVGWETYYLAHIATLPADAIQDLVSAITELASCRPGYRKMDVAV